MRLRLISGVPQRSQSDNSALRALANRSPRSESRPTLTDGAPTAPVAILKPSQVVSGLGLSTAMEEALTTRVVAWMALDKPIDVAKRLRVDLNGSVHDPRQRAEIARRFWRLWDSKHDRPSLVLHKAVKPAPGQIGLFAAPAKAKAGPFIGPRGGKWADPQHTIPWQEPSAPKQRATPKEKEVRGEPPVKRKSFKATIQTWVTSEGKGTTKEHLEQLLSEKLAAQKKSTVYGFKVEHAGRHPASGSGPDHVREHDEWTITVDHREAIPGHTLVGHVETGGDGLITIFDDATKISKETYARAQHGGCDVCNTKRQRNKVFVVERAKDGKQIVVGGECAKKFHGADLEALSRQLSDVGMDVVESLREDEEFGGGGGGGRAMGEPFEVLGVALWLTRKQGYRKKDDTGIGTASGAEAIVGRYKGVNLSNEEWAEIKKVQAEVKKDLPQIKDWVKEQIGDGKVFNRDQAFMVSVSQLLDRDFIGGKNFSRVAWVPYKYYRVQAAKKLQETQKAYEPPSAKMHDLPGKWTIAGKSLKESSYGSYWGITAQRDDGSRIWFRGTGAESEDLHEGDTVTLRGKLKSKADKITFMSHMKIDNESGNARKAAEAAEAEKHSAERKRLIESDRPEDVVRVELHELYDPRDEKQTRLEQFRTKQSKAVVELVRRGVDIPSHAVSSAIDYYDGYKAREKDPALGSALRQYNQIQDGHHPVEANEFMRLFPEIAAKKIREKLTAKQAEYLLERDLSKPSFFGPPIAKSLSEHVNLRFIGADLVLIVDDLEKGIGHKYLKRIPTGKPKPKYRYIYKLPTRFGLVADDELKAGTKIRVEHAGKEGHFEVEQHDKERGIVRLRHDESGKTAHVKHRDLKRMVESYHSKKAGGKGIGGPPLKLRPKGVQTEISTPKVAPEKPAAKPLKSVSIDDISQWSGIVGFAPSAEDAAAMASKMSKDGHEYGAIQQPAGFAIVERKKKAKVKGEAVGEATKVFMRDSSGKGIASMDAEYVVMEADKVIASHKPTENFKLHSGYPSDVQERRYEDLPGEQLKVQRISRNLEPQLVANTNPDAVNGAPVITEDGVVLGGNGRTMGMQLAHAQEPEAAAKYKAYLTAHAREFGLSAEEVGQIKSPILIRRVKAGKDTAKLRKLGRRMNESLTQGLDPRTAEVALGKNYVNRELVDVLVDQMAPDESLADYLHNSKSTTFVNALQRSGIIDEMNHDEFVGDDGLLNEDGRSRVERVLAARFIPDAKLLSKMPQTLRQNVAKSTPYLLRAESAGWDLREPLKAAVLADIDFRANFKGTTKQYLAQTTMKGADHPVDVLHKDPMAGLMFDVVRNFNGSTRMPAGFRSFARRAEAAAHDKGGFAMFATAAETPTQALDRSFGITPETKKELSDAAEAARQQERELLARAGVTEQTGKKKKTKAEPQPQELALSQSDRWWDELNKSVSVKDEHLSAYLMNAIVGELNHLMGSCRNVAALRGNGLHVKAGSIRRRLLDWLAYEVEHDPEMARAIGQQEVTDEMLDGLIEATANVNASKLQKD